MTTLHSDLLAQLLASASEPLLVARVDRPDWPVVLSNPAFNNLAGTVQSDNRPLADVVEQLLGRELALEVSETVRSAAETSIPVECQNREYLLVVLQVLSASEPDGRYCALFWRGGSLAMPANAEMRQALLRARRRVRDLSRDDLVTGLLNEAAFREVLAHDWAVASREKGSLALGSFVLDDFAAYVEVFGRHAADSCLRRVAQALRRHLRRASDVAARITVGDGEHLVVLSHASDQSGLEAFADRIAVAVRDLGIHHPRSKASRFVTVSYKTALVRPGDGDSSADDLLNQVLAS
ncbi:MAG TPA: GGDEF domain-containing protein [Woeseiaceae bacterium]